MYLFPSTPDTEIKPRDKRKKVITIEKSIKQYHPLFYLGGDFCSFLHFNFLLLFSLPLERVSGFSVVGIGVAGGIGRVAHLRKVDSGLKYL